MKTNYITKSNRYQYVYTYYRNAEKHDITKTDTRSSTLAFFHINVLIKISYIVNEIFRKGIWHEKKKLLKYK